MTSDGDGARRRDVLRASAGTGLLGFAGLAATDALRVEGESERATQSGGANYAFSESLQAGDRFRVLFRAPDDAEAPVSRTVPADCFDDNQSRESRLYVVRAYRGQVRLGVRGLFVPDGDGTATTRQTTSGNATATAGNQTTTLGNETTELGNETDTPGNETATPGNETATPDNETTPAGNETTALDNGTAANGTTTDGADAGAGLPEITVGEWYEVASSAECDGLFRLTLEAADAPRTTTG